MRTAKIILINMGVFFLLLLFLEGASIAIFKIKSSVSRSEDTVYENPYAKLANNREYQDYLRAERQRKYEYRAFIGWVHSDINMGGVYVTNGIRFTPQKPQERSGQNTIFFGGSTVWGSFVKDDHTIPSFYAMLDENSKIINEFSWN